MVSSLLFLYEIQYIYVKLLELTQAKPIIFLKNGKWSIRVFCCTHCIEWLRWWSEDKVLWRFYCAFLTFRWEEHILEMFSMKKRKKSVYRILSMNNDNGAMCEMYLPFFQHSECAKIFQQHLRGFALRWNLNPVFLWSLVVLWSFGQIKSFMQYLSKSLPKHCVKTYINGYSKYILFLIFYCFWILANIFVRFFFKMFVPGKMTRTVLERGLQKRKASGILKR